VGEIKDASVLDGPGPNIWTYSYANQSSLRSTANLPNLPTCTPANVNAGIYCGDAYVIGGNPYTNGGFGSEHAGGTLFVFVDGHVSFVNDNIDEDSYWHTATIAGGEESVVP
jgi:prepilin-type processing-associated H-X9-DG protein